MHIYSLDMDARPSLNMGRHLRDNVKNFGFSFYTKHKKEKRYGTAVMSFPWSKRGNF